MHIADTSLYGSGFQGALEDLGVALVLKGRVDGILFLLCGAEPEYVQASPQGLVGALKAAVNKPGFRLGNLAGCA